MKTILRYVGRVISSKNKLIHKYLDQNNETILFGDPLIMCSVGSIIECEREGDTFKRPYNYKGKIEEEDQLTLWVEQDWANKKEMDIKRDMKKVPKTKYHNIVSDLNYIITGLPRSQRLLFKMKLLNDLK